MNDKGKPSGASIGCLTLAWLVVAGVTFWMAWEVETSREITGVVLGFLLAYTLLGQLFGRLARRGAHNLAEYERAREQEMEARVHDPDFPRQTPDRREV